MTVLWIGTGEQDMPTPMPAGVSVGYTNGLGTDTVYENIYTTTNGPMFGCFPWATGVTSLWFRCIDNCDYGCNIANKPLIGVGKSGVTAGIFIGSGPTQKIAILKWDGATVTLLAEATQARPAGSYRCDLRISNHGATATVALYVNNTEYIAPTTVNTTLAGLTDFDCVKLGQADNTLTNNHRHAGIIVADSDTRMMAGVQMIIPNAAGDANAWDGGTYQDIDDTSGAQDSDSIYTNVAARDVQFNLPNFINGLYKPAMVKVCARAARTPGSTPANLGLGFKTNGTVSAGTAQAVAEAKYDHFSQSYLLNPVTGLPWTAAEIDALQLNLHSS